MIETGDREGREPTTNDAARAAMPAPARFTVRARADPQTLPRLVNFVAQLGLTPSQVKARAAEGSMTVLIEQRGLTDAQAGTIAEKIRASFLVQSVALSRGQRRLTPLSEYRP